MAFVSHLRNLDEGDKTAAVRELIAASTPDFDFFFLTTLAVFMATLGLLAGSAAVVIGSMLVAPILFPILSLGLGLSMSDFGILRRAAFTLLKAFLLGVLVAAGATFLFAPEAPLTGEVLARTEPSLLFFMISLAAGLAVAYAMAKPKLSATLPGIAIAVAVLPPIAVTGIGLAVFAWDVVGGSLALLLVNILGILFGALVYFSLVNLHGKRGVAASAMRKEDARVKREEEEAEKIAESP